MSRPAIAALLSFLIPGVGQIYNREVLRGLFWLIITPALWIGSAGFFGWIVHLISAATAYHRAELQEGLPRDRPPARLAFAVGATQGGLREGRGLLAAADRCCRGAPRS